MDVPACVMPRSREKSTWNGNASQKVAGLTCGTRGHDRYAEARARCECITDDSATLKGITEGGALFVSRDKFDTKDTHTHTTDRQIDRQTHTHTNTHTHILCLRCILAPHPLHSPLDPNTHTCSYTRAHTHTHQTHTRTNTHPSCHFLAYFLIQARRPTRIRFTLTHTHHTHTHKYEPFVPVPRLLPPPGTQTNPHSLHPDAHTRSCTRTRTRTHTHVHSRTRTHARTHLWFRCLFPQ